MTYEELIRAFAERYDAVSALTEDGSLAIEVDGTRVSFREANGAAAIVAHVCAMPEDANGRVARLLLKASALMAAAGSGAFTLDESTREVSIACTLPAVRIDVDALSKTVEWLVDACHEWQGNIMAIAAVDDELERKRLEERALNPLFGGNFIRV
jgi:hypothetical protein